MKCFDDGREVTIEDCRKCEFIMCACCGGCMLEYQTKEELKEMEEPMTNLETASPDETRIFCVFLNNKTGKWRLTQADRVFILNKVRDGTPEDILEYMRAEYKKHEVKNAQN